MTPREAAEMLEKLTPVEVKLGLVDLLEWQAAKGKAVVNFNWYLNCLKYRREPRPKGSPELARLLATIGHSTAKSG